MYDKHPLQLHYRNSLQHRPYTIPYDYRADPYTDNSLVVTAFGRQYLVVTILENSVDQEIPDELVPVEFVAEDDVRRALQHSRQIIVDDRTIVTPAAHDLAMDHGVFVDLSAGRTR